MVYGRSHRSFRSFNGRQLLNFILIKYFIIKTPSSAVASGGCFFIKLLYRVLQTMLED